jgi:hypothetical protein
LSFSVGFPLAVKSGKHHHAGWVVSALLSAILVYGLIASPLRVECIAEGGTTQVELIGQDPCHHPGSHLAAPAACAPAISGDYDPTDPCLDLILENPALAQSAADIQVPQATTADPHQGIAVVSDGLFPTLSAAVFFKLARDPAECGICNSSISDTLRI